VAPTLPLPLMMAQLEMEGNLRQLLQGSYRQLSSSLLFREGVSGAISISIFMRKQRICDILFAKKSSHLTLHNANEIAATEIDSSLTMDYDFSVHEHHDDDGRDCGHDPLHQWVLPRLHCTNLHKTGHPHRQICDSTLLPPFSFHRRIVDMHQGS
jgi:hypothetical protein